MAIQDRFSDREQEAFHSMLTQLRTGRKKVLSSNQREWVERIWMDFQLMLRGPESLELRELRPHSNHQKNGVREDAQTASAPEENLKRLALFFLLPDRHRPAVPFRGP